MSLFSLFIGSTFLIKYRHEGSGAGVSFTAMVQKDSTEYPVTFTWVDQLAGIGEFRAATGTWVPGEYVFQYKQTGGGLIIISDPLLEFTMKQGLPL